MKQTKISLEALAALSDRQKIQEGEIEVKKLGIHYVVNKKGVRRSFDKPVDALEFINQDERKISAEEKKVNTEIKKERKQLIKQEKVVVKSQQKEVKAAVKKEKKARRRASKIRKFFADITYVIFSLGFALIAVLLVGLPQLVDVLVNKLGVAPEVIEAIRTTIGGFVGGNVKFYIAGGFALLLVIISVLVQLQKTVVSKVLGITVGTLIFAGVAFGLAYINSGLVLEFSELVDGFVSIFSFGPELKDNVQVGLFGFAALQFIIPLSIGWGKK